MAVHGIGNRTRCSDSIELVDAVRFVQPAESTMRNATFEDPWLLPSRQGEHPGREIVPVAQLHQRREKTFLVLSGLFVAAVAAALILGTSRIIDVEYALAAIHIELPTSIALDLPFGVLALPFAFFAINLVAELYGRRRANAVLVTGLLVSLSLVGVMYAADVLDGSNAALGGALAFASYYLIAFPSDVIILDALGHGRGASVRQVVSTVLAQLGGWAAFAFVAYGYGVSSGADASIADSIASLVVTSAVFVAVTAIVSVLPYMIALAPLRTYLRVEPEALEVTEAKHLPPAMLVEVADDEIDVEPVVLAPAAPLARERVAALWTTGERRFFTEGDELSETGELVDR